MCTAVGLTDDALSMKSVMTKVFKKMETLMSLCAVQEGTNDLVGVLIATPFDKSKWYIQKEQGETLRQIMKLKNLVTTKSQYYGIGSESAVCIDVICVKSDHQSNGIGTALLRSCVTRASYFASTCVGQFTTNAAQTIGERLNFSIVYELPYQELGSRKNRFHVFESCHPRNYSIACMVVRLSPPPMELLLAPPYVSAIKFSKSKLKSDKEKKGKVKKSKKIK